MTMTKKALIAGAFLTAAGIAGTATAGAPVVYGKANVSLESVKGDIAGTDYVDQWELDSNASRLGVKGKHKIDNNLSVFYKAEYEISVDDGDKDGQTFTQRNIYAGIGGSFGKVQAGKFDTPLKKAQGKFDRFNDLAGDIKHVVLGEDRESNMIQYSSPKIADSVTVNVALQPGEGNDSDGDGNADDGVADNVSASVVYSAGGAFAALAVANGFSTKTDSPEKVFKDELATEIKANADVTRLVGGYKGDGFTVHGLYQTADIEGSPNLDVDSLGLSGSIKVGSGVTLEGQYLMTTYSEGGIDLDVAQLTVGAEKKLNKKTKLFGYYSAWSAEEGTDEVDESTIGLGMEVKF